MAVAVVAAVVIAVASVVVVVAAAASVTVVVVVSAVAAVAVAALVTAVVVSLHSPCHPNCDLVDRSSRCPAPNSFGPHRPGPSSLLHLHGCLAEQNS